MLYPPHDHDGRHTNDAGQLALSQKYWPSGALRSGGITGTGKLYTGQRQEPGDSALGLYNYKARFYSTDAGNRLKTRSVTGGTVTYLYDVTGATVKRTNADGTWTVYVEGIYERDSSGTVRKYYQAYGRPIAMRDVPSGFGTVYHLLADHLGGTLTGLKKQVSGTSTQWSFNYWPYGATRTSSGTSKSDEMFTGQRQETGDSALGLYDYQARFHSTTLGRFLSVDPIGGSEGDPQSWNPYTYVRNNPLVYVDPTGMECSRNPTTWVG